MEFLGNEVKNKHKSVSSVVSDCFLVLLIKDYIYVLDEYLSYK